MLAVLCILLSLACTPLHSVRAAPLSGARTAPLHFAVLGNLPAGTAQEPAARILLDAVAQGQPAFVLDTGNLKLATEPCSDALLHQRMDLLDSSPAPLIFIPGAHDWIDCQRPEAGGYDPLERLDFLREQLLSGSESLGRTRIPVTRESNLARFRPFRENIEWQQGPVLFVGLNVGSNGNHYFSGGGRNGEFEDRVVANRYWLEQALHAAQRRHVEAVVIAIEADPRRAQPVRRRPFDWLSFGAAQPEDAYQDFKRDLFKFAQQFSGPVLLIHQASFAATAGAPPARETATAGFAPAFRLEPPGHRKKGQAPMHLWQLQINANAEPYRWVNVDIVTGREPLFRAATRKVAPGTAPDAAHDGADPAATQGAAGAAAALRNAAAGASASSSAATPDQTPDPTPDAASGVSALHLPPLPAETVPRLLDEDPAPKP